MIINLPTKVASLGVPLSSPFLVSKVQVLVGQMILSCVKPIPLSPQWYGFVSKQRSDPQINHIFMVKIKFQSLQWEYLFPNTPNSSISIGSSLSYTYIYTYYIYKNTYIYISLSLSPCLQVSSPISSPPANLLQDALAPIPPERRRALLFQYPNRQVKTGGLSNH